MFGGYRRGGLLHKDISEGTEFFVGEADIELGVHVRRLQAQKPPSNFLTHMFYFSLIPLV